MKGTPTISSVFIALSFIAGLYGVNIELLPELKRKFGYFFVLGLMVTITGSLLFWFRRWGWFCSV